VFYYTKIVKNNMQQQIIGIKTACPGDPCEKELDIFVVRLLLSLLLVSLRGPNHSLNPHSKEE
jgi:hypothetical protein